MRSKSNAIGQLRVPAHEGLDESHLARQVIGVIRRETPQFFEQCRRHSLRLRMLQTVDDAVSHRLDRREDRLRLEPLEQKIDPRAVVGGIEAAALRCSSRIADDQIRAAQPDAIDLPVEPPLQRGACFIHREANAG